MEDSVARLRFRIITGLVRRRRRFRSRPLCTSSLPPGRTLRPTSRMTLWAARVRARQAPHRGVLAVALDSKSVRLNLVNRMANFCCCYSPVGYVDYIQLDAEDVEL
jgi:hypothetical protein